MQAHGNCLLFGGSGTGKSHIAAAIAYGLIEAGFSALFVRTNDLVQRLQAARRDLALPALLTKLDRIDCLILDDLGYSAKGSVGDEHPVRVDRRALRTPQSDHHLRSILC